MKKRQPPKPAKPSAAKLQKEALAKCARLEAEAQQLRSQLGAVADDSERKGRAIVELREEIADLKERLAFSGDKLQRLCGYVEVCGKTMSSAKPS